MKTALRLAALCAIALPAAALTGDNKTFLTAQDLAKELASLTPVAQQKGSSGSTLYTGGNLALKTSIRTTSGGAEIHAHADDLMIVQQGSATLITGGTIVDYRPSTRSTTLLPL